MAFKVTKLVLDGDTSEATIRVELDDGRYYERTFSVPSDLEGIDLDYVAARLRTPLKALFDRVDGTNRAARQLRAKLDADAENIKTLEDRYRTVVSRRV